MGARPAASSMIDLKMVWRWLDLQHAVMNAWPCAVMMATLKWVSRFGWLGWVVGCPGVPNPMMWATIEWGRGLKHGQQLFEAWRLVMWD